MFNPTPDMAKRLQNAPEDTKKLLVDLLSDAILSSSIPEESKIEVRIMQAYNELDVLFHRTTRAFRCPIPLTEEGKALAKRIYPARQAFLEYLQLTKAGLENFLVNVPVPDIPPEYIKRAENPFDR